MFNVWGWLYVALRELMHRREGERNRQRKRVYCNRERGEEKRNRELAATAEKPKL